MSDNFFINLRNVTVGIPVFNEQRYIHNTVLSALQQGTQVIVSNNCSTDNTKLILDDLQAKFNNLIVYHQQENIGGFNNFNFVLHKANTEYFMWLGAHDLFPENHVYNLLKIFHSDPLAIGVFGSTKYIDESDTFLYRYDYAWSDFLSSLDQLVRVKAIISKLSDCSIVHALYKKDILKNIHNVIVPCIGYDHALMAMLAAKGKILYTDKTYFIRRDFPATRDASQDALRQEESISSKLKSANGIKRYDKMRKMQLQAVKDIKPKISFFQINYLRYILLIRFYLPAQRTYTYFKKIISVFNLFKRITS
jgi:glycosyltransferase involved in cell wall biosynthesis